MKNDNILDCVCKIIDKYKLTNIRELRRFINKCDGQFGLVNMKNINKVISLNVDLIRLHFDFNFSELKGSKDF